MLYYETTRQRKIFSPVPSKEIPSTGESVTCFSEMYDWFVRLFLSLMEEKDANLRQKMKLNAFFYLRETKKTC